jgi:hypothetical protein
MRPSGYRRPAASAVTTLAATLVMAFVAAFVSAPSLQARDDDGWDENEPWTRRSTWELSTSLTFHRYLEPFERVSSAHACRNRCVRNHHCTGWTYYDASFSEAGDLSYQLQRVCVLGAGLKDRKYGTMRGRTSGVVDGEVSQ